APRQQRAQISKPGAGNFAHSSRTSPAIRACSAASAGATTTASSHAAIWRISGSAMPRLVTDDVPSRIPDGSNGLPVTQGTEVVGCEARRVERLGGELARHVLAGQIGEDQVVVGAAGDQRPAALDQPGGERARIADDLMRVALELVGRGLLERDRDAGGRVVV